MALSTAESESISIKKGPAHAREVRSAMVDVKSTSPTAETGYEKNGYENCIYSMNNIHMSDEDNKHDTNCIN